MRNDGLGPGRWTFQWAAARYGVSLWIIKKLADRLQLGYKSGGHWFISGEELPVLEIGIRSLGYRIPPVADPEVVMEQPQPDTIS
jgi:hypothetical protein